MLRQTETGSEKEIAPVDNNQIGILRFSPDANYLYFTMQPKGALGFILYRVPVLGGELRQIAYDVDSGVSFRPDGKSLIFHRHIINPALDKIIEIKADGGDEKEIYSTDKFFFNPQISPDGNTIVGLSSDKDAQLGTPSTFLVGMPATGGEMTQIGKNWGYAADFSWLKDGSGLIVSGFYGAEEDSKIYILSYPNGDVKQITKDTNSYYGASVTADGKTIATIQSSSVAGIWEWEIASGKARQISPNDRDRIGTEGLTVAPNGKIIYAKQQNKENSEIWEMDFGNNVTKPLTAKNSGRNAYPVISADGSFIFYESFRNGGYDIWRMNADGSNPLQITKTPEIIETLGGVSPDGKSLIFTERSKENATPAIMRISTETGESNAVIKNENQYPQAAQLSPDGKNLLYTNAPTQFDHKVIPQSSLYISTFDGKNIGQTKEILKTLNSNQYRWSPGGKFLYYTDLSGNNSDVWKLNPADGKTSKITNFNLEKIIRYAVSPDGKKLYLVRGSSTQDIILIKAETN